jgi:hypothetical protein
MTPVSSVPMPASRAQHIEGPQRKREPCSQIGKSWKMRGQSVNSVAPAQMQHAESALRILAA